MARRITYEAPRLELITPRTMQKHRTIDISLAESALDDIGDVRGLMATYGSPLYILSEKTLRAQYRAFRDAFTSPGIDTVVAYSYKTNYLPAVCSILHQEGAWAEVVSGMEYDLARALGVPGSKIIFNGPYKRPEELARAIKEGALINVDGFDDLDQLVSIAGNLGIAARTGLRINFQHGRQSWTKFGLNAENGEAVDALHKIKKAGKKLHFEAFHNHSGTFQVDPDIYARATQVLVSLARTARGLGLSPVIADLGGGYPSNNHLKQAFDVPGGSGSGGQFLAPFAEAITGPLGKARNAFGERPTMVLEPGRALVDAAFRLACTVVARKTIAGQGDAVIVDAGVNLVPTAYWYDHGVNAASTKDLKTTHGSKPIAVFGPLCMQVDVLRERAVLPNMSLGSPLVISNVGAYCITQSMQFIQPRPAVVMLGRNGVEEIRRRETRSDIFAMDRVPARLKAKGAKF